MEQQTRQCQNCKTDFTIEPEDFQFYEKVAVPPPTFCPPCRFQRRLVFWNPITLYKRTCGLCKKPMITVYHPDAPYTVYCPPCWWSDNWDPLAYGRDYDFSRPFFEQLQELWHAVPLVGLSMDLTTCKTSPYNHDAGYLKNCYLMFHADSNEDCAYGYYVGKSRMLIDCTAILECEYGYDAMHSYRTNRCIGSRRQLSNAIDCLFLRDCQDCQNCFASANLKKKKYWAWNEPMTKEAYLAEVSRYDLGSHRTYREVQERAEAHWATHIVKSEYNEFATDCTGPNVFFSKNCKDCIEVQSAEDCRYLYRMFGPSNKSCYDISMWGNNLSFSYEGLVVGENSTSLKFCYESGINLQDAEYCKLSTGGSHHFGCVSIKKGEYRILNKAYSREEYETLTKKIRNHMDEVPYISKKRQGTSDKEIIYKYGEFFPPEMSPFAYNETLAQNFFPRTEAAAKAAGFRWQDPKKQEQEPTMQSADLPDHIKDAPVSILEELIACARCAKPYRIIAMELLFLRSMNLPLPRECPFCRITEKMNLWVKNLERNTRTCADCGKTVESSYREQEAEKVYCRACYLARIP